MAVELILVPQGAEYSAVVRGLKREGITIASLGEKGTKLCPIPLGASTLAYLQHFFPGDPRSRENLWEGKTVILMGLGGSLSSKYNVGDIVLPQSLELGGSIPSFGVNRSDDECNDHRLQSQNESLQKKFVIEPSLVNRLYQRLCFRISSLSQSVKIGMGHAITSDRIITTPKEKQRLGDLYDAELIDMEGAYVLDFFQARGAQVAIVRVISDGSDVEIPDLNSAIDDSGNLIIGAMTWQFLQQPRAAIQLIQGSLKGLQCLESVSVCCATLLG